MTKTTHWKGWKNEQPGTHQRTIMRRKCGSRCFLGKGKGKSFPICTKGTCRVNKKGVYAAYIRSRQYRKRGEKYRRVSEKAAKMLRNM
jgi:hypothetical protein